MDDDSAQFTIEAREHIADIPAADWDRFAMGDGGGAYNPLQSHAFLKALEDSGAVKPETGWIPRHLLLKNRSGDLRGVMPFYAKTHSWGEYVFDHAWAGAFERAGGQYYPKGLCAIPFTPVPGARLMAGDSEAMEALAGGAVQAGAALGLSSLHVNFIDDTARAFFEKREEWILRKGVQYHWHNRGYDSFDDFLAALSSRKRKSIKRERRALQEAGVRFHHLTGEDIKATHWDDFYLFYLTTIDRKWGGAYLTREFFDRIGAALARNILLVMAEKDGEAIAGALNFIGGDTLYGRNWGCGQEIPFLHFETCYYQAIDFAIKMRLARVEAGAQGLHKVQRGYEPCATWSAHFFYARQLSNAVRDFTEREGMATDFEIAELRRMSPYRKSGGAT